jgi:para-aminobenzoate synthetase/4-amino-4-deoxychorismate lyase
VGGGITWASDPAREWTETLNKAQVLTRRQSPFELLETLRWEPGEGYWLLEGHLARLGDSARYFNFAWDERAIRAELEALAASFEPVPQRVRLLMDRRGAVRLESTALEIDDSPQPWRAAIAAEPVPSDDLFLYHKTTHRDVYKRARRERPGVDEVILWNERGELTETCVANLVVELGGRRLTPARGCGLLAGVYRQWLLERGEIEEVILTRADLARAHRLWAINSLRGWVELELAQPTAADGAKEALTNPGSAGGEIRSTKR